MRYVRVMRTTMNNNPRKRVDKLFGKNIIRRCQQNFNNRLLLSIKERSKMRLEIFIQKIPCLTVKGFEFADSPTVPLTK